MSLPNDSFGLRMIFNTLYCFTLLAGKIHCVSESAQLQGLSEAILICFLPVLKLSYRMDVSVLEDIVTQQQERCYRRIDVDIVGVGEKREEMKERMKKKGKREEDKNEKQMMEAGENVKVASLLL